MSTPTTGLAWITGLSSRYGIRFRLLDAPIRLGDGQTILREALLVADHNAYHLGQLVFLRRCLGAWED